MDSKSICEIIDSCGKSGVRVFKYGSLYLALGPAPQKIIQTPYPLDVSAADHAKQNQETLERDEEEVRAERLALLQIEDPMEYERQIQENELDEEPEDKNED